MRALITTDTVGGVFSYCADLIRGLREEGVEVVVAGMGGRLSAEQREALAGVAVYESSLRLEWMSDPWEDLAEAQEWLLDIERRERPDVIHANSYFCGGVEWRAPVLVVAHSCVFSWWHAVHGCAPPRSWERYFQVVQAGLRCAGAAVAVSQAMRDAIENIYGAPRSRTRVIHNGSSAPAFRADAKQPFVLAAGRLWDEAKNLGALERAAEHADIPVLVAGEARAPGGQPAHPDNTSVQLLGQLPPAELAHLRRRAAVFAAPARYEPFGLAILEAARDRCALVLGDIPSLREIWGDAAMYVDPDDDRTLTGTLTRLIADAPSAAALGARAQRHSARYSTVAMARSYRALYRELIDHKGALAA